MTFVERFNQLLTEKDLTSYRLSKDLGITDSLIGYWRKGTRQPAMDNLVKLADHFDVSVDYLLGRTDNPQINK